MSFAHQVGGHASTILVSPLSSSTLIKPTSPTELHFYTSLGPSLLDGAFVGEWTPNFYGTLTLEGKLNQQGQLDKVEESQGEQTGGDTMMVLENLTYRFVRPNVLDVKLGTILFDDDATEEKKQRMIKAAESSTSGSLGLRLTGFQVWNSTSQTYHSTAKPFGRKLLSTELLLGLSRFFYPSLTSLSSAERSNTSTTTNAEVDDSSLPVPPTNHPPSLPSDLILPILRTLLHRLERLSQILKSLEIRMRGGSLLIVVEGDPEALERSLLRVQEEQQNRRLTSSPRKDGNESVVDAESRQTRIEGEGDGSVDDEDDGETSSVASTTDEDGNAAQHTLLPFEIRLIDFAHTRDAKGEGHDEGIVKGVDNLRQGIRELIEKIESR